MVARREDRVSGGALDVRVADVAEALMKRNPTAPLAQVELTARLMAAVGATVQQSWPDRSAGLDLNEILENSPSRPDSGEDGASTRPHRKLALAARGPAESAVGSGLGERISRGEGERSLAAHAGAMPLVDWAGPVAGSTELAARLGIARSTLQDWRRNGAVIGLLKGTRKHVFPLAQFVDARPIPGVAELVEIVGDARAAWLWLVEPRRDTGSPLEDLKQGRIEAVLKAARADFA